MLLHNMKIVWEYGMYLWYLFIKLQPYPRTEMQKRESNFQSRKIRRYTIWNFYHRNIEKKYIYIFFHQSNPGKNSFEFDMNKNLY